MIAIGNVKFITIVIIVAWHACMCVGKTKKVLAEQLFNACIINASRYISYTKEGSVVMPIHG